MQRRLFLLPLISMLFLSGCLGQPVRPKMLSSEKLETQATVFGSIEYPFDNDKWIGDTFDAYVVIVESLDTDEVHEFGMQELGFDEEKDGKRKALFLRSLTPGAYALTRMRFRAGYWHQEYTFTDPEPFNVNSGETAYLGNYFVERIGSSLGVLGHPRITISGKLASDSLLARKLYDNFPAEDDVTVARIVPADPIVIGRSSDQGGESLSIDPCISEPRVLSMN